MTKNELRFKLEKEIYDYYDFYEINRNNNDVNFSEEFSFFNEQENIFFYIDYYYDYTFNICKDKKHLFKISLYRDNFEIVLYNDYKEAMSIYSDKYINDNIFNILSKFHTSTIIKMNNKFSSRHGFVDIDEKIIKEVFKGKFKKVDFQLEKCVVKDKNNNKGLSLYNSPFALNNQYKDYRSYIEVRYDDVLYLKVIHNYFPKNSWQEEHSRARVKDGEELYNELKNLSKKYKDFLSFLEAVEYKYNTKKCKDYYKKHFLTFD